MNKNAIIIVIVLIVIFMIGGYFLLNKDKDQNQDAQQNEFDASNKPNEIDQSYSGSLEDLIKKGGSLKCVFEGKDESGNFSGTSYVGEGKAMQDMETVEGIEKTDIHVILADGWTYMWSSAQPDQGTKVYVNLSQQEEAELKHNFEKNKAELTKNNQISKDKFSYECSPWQVDNSIFEPPKNIVFKDIAEMTNISEQQIVDKLNLDANETNQNERAMTDCQSACGRKCGADADCLTSCYADCAGPAGF
jgi:hypothetical protein